MYCASDDEEIIQEGIQSVKESSPRTYVRPDEAEKVKSIIRERGSFKVIDKVTVKLNERRDAMKPCFRILAFQGVEIPAPS
jgi:ATP-dependent Lon protease